MSFNEIFKRLLGRDRGETTCTRLVRSEKHMAAYTTWVKEQVYLNWTGPFFKAYHYKKANLPSQFRVQITQDEYVRGVIFFYDPSIGANNFTYFFDLLKDRVQAQGYTLHSCDKLKVRHERYTEMVEKHVLTPPASDVSGTSLCNQLYGNILLDYIKVNNQPGYIRFATNVYNDPYFSKPLPFDELLDKVLQPDEVQVN
ncbi:hypothetical protein DXT99_02145 [Pontibacter diazotrophicus]|uniref:Uncharacterized protein n=1 Tax=Pontibacter diazotrophicus TaxID=1400979 RepID=A0A3D8LHQ5_9BACT|nr:hypothetical protein [Pontibacter diazotrophicus]RDV16925.1 hypothetical protein DXT99_02145 [Pontibacter diazotrophicus]